MKPQVYKYTLNDLLCLSKFKQSFEPASSDDIIKAITEWAEQEVMVGNDSEPLLILASLNLDKTPDTDEVYYYLNGFMREQGISYPEDKLSALIWLKIKLWHITHCTDAQTAETDLYYFATRFWDTMPGFFSSACNHLSYFYYYLFDSYGNQYCTPAEEMTAEQLLTCIQERVSQIERKLVNQDWLEFLTAKDTNMALTETVSE